MSLLGRWTVRRKTRRPQQTRRQAAATILLGWGKPTTMLSCIITDNDKRYGKKNCATIRLVISGSFLSMDSPRRQLYIGRTNTEQTSKSSKFDSSLHRRASFMRCLTLTKLIPRPFEYPLALDPPEARRGAPDRARMPPPPSRLPPFPFLPSSSSLSARALQLFDKI